MSNAAPPRGKRRKAASVPAVDAEGQVVGAMLTDPARAAELVRTLAQSDFVADDHGQVFGLLRAMLAAGTPVDARTVVAALPGVQCLAAPGDADNYLRETLGQFVRGADTAYYVGLVRDAAHRRYAAAAAERLLEAVADPLVPTGDAVAEFAVKAARLRAQCAGTGRDGLPSFAGLDVAELTEAVQEEPDWLVRRVFTTDQPILLGARSKAGKTTQLADLAVALASGTPWLGHFDVPQRRRVLLIVGEASRRAAAKRLHRACSARGLSFGDIATWVRVEAVDFPQLPNALHRAAVRDTVERHKIDCVVIDPLYRGLGDVETTSLAAMGDALVGFAQSCQPAALIVSHHATKTAAREYGYVPELEDLSGAGVAEAAGSWWLLGRNAPYEFDGQHDLSVKYGGRDEQAGGYRIAFDERNWRFDLTPLTEYRVQAAEAAADARESAKAGAVRKDAERVLRAAVHVAGGRATRNQFRELSGLNSAKFAAAWGQLLREAAVRESGTLAAANKQTYPAFEVVGRGRK